jgi:hypothetical protein
MSRIGAFGGDCGSGEGMSGKRKSGERGNGGKGERAGGDDGDLGFVIWWQFIFVGREREQGIVILDGWLCENRKSQKQLENICVPFMSLKNEVDDLFLQENQGLQIQYS